MTDWHLAQMNVGTARHPMEDPRMAGFVSRLDAINALADESPGFVWRLQSESGNATDIKLAEDPLFIVNMSVWETVEALFDFVYRTVHAEVMAGRRDWFERPAEAYQVLWWVAAGHLPTPEEGLARLERLRREGPSAAAFTFKAKFPPPGGAEPATDMEPDPWCVGWS
jgi:hypothetical protein